MKRTYFLAFTLLFSCAISYAQLSIGTPVNASTQAVLEVAASSATSPKATDGIIIPRLDFLPATPPTGAQEGLLIFLKQDYSIYSKGFYHWDNTEGKWVKMLADTGEKQFVSIACGKVIIGDLKPSTLASFEPGTQQGFIDAINTVSINNTRGFFELKFGNGTTPTPLSLGTNYFVFLSIQSLSNRVADSKVIVAMANKTANGFYITLYQTSGTPTETLSVNVLVCTAI